MKTSFFRSVGRLLLGAAVVLSLPVGELKAIDSNHRSDNLAIGQYFPDRAPDEQHVIGVLDVSTENGGQSVVLSFERVKVALAPQESQKFISSLQFYMGWLKGTVGRSAVESKLKSGQIGGIANIEFLRGESSDGSQRQLVLKLSDKVSQPEPVFLDPDEKQLLELIKIYKMVSGKAIAPKS